MKTYVVGDLANRFTEFLKLMDRFEKPCQIIQIGDVIDRGKQAKELVEYLMSHPEIVVLLGNHESLMLEAHGRHHPGLDYLENWMDDPMVWYNNGGDATLASFGGKIPENVLDWAMKLPLQHEFEVEGKLYLVTHAPVPKPHPAFQWHEEPVRIWNRYEPARDSKYALQIYGHNSRLNWVADNHGTYAVCIDDCKSKHLTALELPSQKLLHQPYE